MFNNIIGHNFKKIFSFFIFQLIFIKIKSENLLYSLEDDTSHKEDKTLDDCIFKGYTFYNKYDKKCFLQCNGDNKYTVYKGDEEGNCFTERCPTNYPYKDIAYHQCVKKCENYYCGNNCVNSCNDCSSGDYYFANEKKCLSLNDCKGRGRNGLTIYYDTVNKKCDFSCKELGKPYILEEEKSFSSIKCYSRCEDTSNKYYYENNYICLKDCDFLIDGNSFKCLNICEKYVDVNGKRCINSCNTNQKYVIENYNDTFPVRVKRCKDNRSSV